MQTAHTLEALASLIKNPQNWTKAVEPVIEELGGKLQGTWLYFGEADVVAIVEMPDNASAAAFSLAAAAGGALQIVKTGRIAFGRSIGRVIQHSYSK